MHGKLACLSLLLICGSAFAQDVSMFRGNLQHTGVYASAGVPKFSRVIWQFHTRGMVIGWPGLLGGFVYAGSDDGNFYAIDAQSGAQRGKFEVMSRVPSTRVIAGAV